MANCDDRPWIDADMLVNFNHHSIPGVIPPPPAWPPAAGCAGAANRRRCPNKRQSQLTHLRPAADPLAPPVFVNPHRACDTCIAQGIAMLRCDKTPRFGAPLIEYGTHHLFYGIPLGGQHLGVHRLGRLCRNCEDDEISAYHTRLYGGTRKPGAPGTQRFNLAQAKAANTCLYQADLAKPYCYRDRRNMLLDIQTASRDNAGQLQWLEHLDFNPVTQKAEFVATPAALAALRARRVANVSEDNACRCGAEIPLAGPAQFGGPNNIPIPVAMCTACSGVVVDPTHPRVVNWRTGGRPPRGPSTETNLRLGRNVPRV